MMIFKYTLMNQLTGKKWEVVSDNYWEIGDTSFTNKGRIEVLDREEDWVLLGD